MQLKLKLTLKNLMTGVSFNKSHPIICIVKSLLVIVVWFIKIFAVAHADADMDPDYGNQANHKNEISSNTYHKGWFLTMMIS